MKSVSHFLLILLILAGNAFAEYPADPAGVVTQFVATDAKGAALSSDTSADLLKYTNWEDAPGYDTFTLVQSSEVGEAAIKGKTATIPVTFTQAGQFDGSDLTLEPLTQTVTFSLVLKAGQWKIVDPQLDPHLSKEGAIKFFKTVGSALPSAAAAVKKLQELK